MPGDRWGPSCSRAVHAQEGEVSEAASSPPLKPKKGSSCLSHTPQPASPPGISFSGAGKTIMILSDRRNGRETLSFQFPYLHLIRPKDAGEQGLNGEFLMDARILFLLAPTQLICLADRLISLLKAFSPNTKDWRGFQALLEKSKREPPLF